MSIDKTLKLFLNLLRQTIFGEELQKLTLSDQIFAHIQSTYQFALTIHLWVGGPSTEVTQPISHVLILKNVVVGKLYVLRSEQVEQGFGEATLWLVGRALDEDDDWRFAQNALDFGVPDLLLLLEVVPEVF
jgi:hypothetical protein